MRKVVILLILGWLLVGGCAEPTASIKKTTPTSPPIAPGSIAERGTQGITLALAGDLMLGRWVNVMILEKGALYPWGDVLPLIRDADLSLVNLECVIAEGGEPFTPPRVFYFRAHPKAMEVLTLAGIDYVTLSNNHALDFQAPALLETIRHLNEHGIAHAGAGRNLGEASKFAMLEAKGLKVGVVAFADHFREYAATESTPGINFIPITLEERYFRRVRESIEATRAAGADLVVFSIHWGPNMRHAPTQEFVDFAHAVMDAGADIFHGHSAHIFQGIEIYKGKPILYDTGDLIDDYYVYEEHKNDQQLLFLITATPEGLETKTLSEKYESKHKRQKRNTPPADGESFRLERIELVPLLISICQVNRAEGPVFNEIFERIRKLSEAMGTEVRQEGDRLVIDIPRY